MFKYITAPVTPSAPPLSATGTMTNYPYNPDFNFSILSNKLSGISNHHAMPPNATMTTASAVGPSGSQTHGVSNQPGFIKSLNICSNCGHVTDSVKQQSTQPGGIGSAQNLQPAVPILVRRNNVSFDKMTFSELAARAGEFELAPNCNAAGRTIFNEALTQVPFNFKPEVVDHIRASFDKINWGSYHCLSEFAYCIGLTKAALEPLLRRNKITKQQFALWNAQLAKLAKDVSDLGNDYHDRTQKKPKVDENKCYLKVASGLDNKFYRMWKRADALDTRIKAISRGNPEIKIEVENRLESLVGMFLYNFYDHSHRSSPDGREIKLMDYIRPGAIEPMRAYFNFKGYDEFNHMAEAGGLQHTVESFAEIFNHLWRRDQIDEALMQRQ